MGTLSLRLFLLTGAAALCIAATPEPKPAPDTTIAGEYLAAHAAQYNGDWKTAGALLAQVWQRTHDKDTLPQAFLISLGAGSMDQALSLAHDVKPPMAESSIATALLVGDALKKNDLAGAAKLIDTLPATGISLPLKAMLNAWIDAAQGRHADAITKLDSLKNFDAYRALHTAMIDEFTGNYKEADAAYAALVKDKPVPRVAAIAAGYYRRTNRPQLADALIEGLSPKTNIAAISVHNAHGPASAAPTLASGASEAFYDMAELLLEADHPDIGLFYAVIAAHVDPTKTDTNLLIGEIEQAQGRHIQAAQSFESVPDSSGFGLLARLDAALAYEEGQQPAKAIASAEALAKSRPDLPEPAIALGDLLRRQNQFAKAVDAYSHALAIVKPDDPVCADIIFARAIAYDSLHKDKAAEADLRAAVALAPERATLLNYLGFFWASRHENLDQAHAMLDHAYRLAPTDGAIADSMGWVLYQMGDYKNSVPYLEQAVSLMPGDSEINGHLGDAYWRVGRVSDARFQWRHALLNAPATTAQGFKTRLIDGIVDTKPAVPGESHAALDAIPSQQ